MTLDDIVCLVAQNSSPMTGAGTNSYVLPREGIVIDPGPDLPAHRGAIMAALAGRPVAAILVTHAHLDHTEMVPWLAAQTGARVMSFGPVTQGGTEVDLTHRPDVILHDGMTVQGISVLHTPGHMRGHLCFSFRDSLFTGDHVMGWSTSLVAPPEGDMAQYRASLVKLQGGTWRSFLPGHGGPITNPGERLDHLIAHRSQREAMIRAALGQGGTATAIAARVYGDLAPALLPAAALNVLAHLIELMDRKQLVAQGPLGVQTWFAPI